MSFNISSDMVTSIADLLTEIFKRSNRKDATKYQREVTETSLALVDEDAKYPYEDSAKIETLMAKLPIFMEAAKNEMQYILANSNSKPSDS